MQCNCYKSRFERYILVHVQSRQIFNPYCVIRYIPGIKLYFPVMQTFYPFSPTFPPHPRPTGDETRTTCDLWRWRLDLLDPRRLFILLNKKGKAPSLLFEKEVPGAYPNLLTREREVQQNK